MHTLTVVFVGMISILTCMLGIPWHDATCVRLPEGCLPPIIVSVVPFSKNPDQHGSHHQPLALLAAIIAGNRKSLNRHAVNASVAAVTAALYV